MPWVKFLLMNITLVSWLEFPLAYKNPISFQGKFGLRNKCRKPCNKVGFIQNLRFGVQGVFFVLQYLAVFL